jgi:hypothetical protein
MASGPPRSALAMKHRRWAIAILWDGVAVTAITMVLIINGVIPPFIVTTWGLLGAGA